MPMALWTTPQLVIMMGLIYREIGKRLSINLGSIEAQWQWDNREWSETTIDNQMTLEHVAELLNQEESPQEPIEQRAMPSTASASRDVKRGPTEPPFPPPGFEEQQPPWKKRRED